MTTDQVQHCPLRDTERRLGQRGCCQPDADRRGVVAIARDGRGPTVESAVNREPRRGARLFHPRVRGAPAA
jgi:hypothetical protein